MDKKKKTQFTNEQISQKFKSSFELVNYAIALAENMIKSGRDTRVKSETQNRAMQILEEIVEGKDQFDEILEGAARSAEPSISSELQQQLLYEEKQEKRKGHRFVEEFAEE